MRQRTTELSERSRERWSNGVDERDSACCGTSRRGRAGQAGCKHPERSLKSGAWGCGGRQDSRSRERSREAARAGECRLRGVEVLAEVTGSKRSEEHTSGLQSLAY